MPIFTEKERKLIDVYADTTLTEAEREARLSELDISEKDVKSRLRTSKTEPLRVVRIIRELANDIERVEHYFNYVEGDRSNLHRIRTELEIQDVYYTLEHYTDYWQRSLENTPPEDVHSSLSPLHEDLESIDRMDRVSEWNQRSHAVFWLLEESDYTSEAVELLQFIRDNSWRQQQNSDFYEDNRIGGQKISGYGSRWLGGEHNLLTEDERSGSKKAYQLTDRGEAVLATVEELLQSDTVRSRADRKQKPRSQVAASILSEHF